jgi:succinoglycan biosynthesis transport protein ExoP
MDLRQYARVLRRQWVIIALSVIVCTVLAGVLAWERTPTYSAQSQLFVSTRVPAGLSEIYAGSLFAEQRIASYAEIVSSRPVVSAVIKQLNLPDTVAGLQREIHASVPPGTVLINVTVEDSSPLRAKAIADEVAEQFSSFVTSLETAPGEKPPVKVSITAPAQVPTSPVSPKKRLYLLLGVLLGLLLGVGGAVLREAFDRRIRGEDDAEAVAHVPVLASVAERPTRARKPLIVLDEPHSARAEEYRRLRTNLGLAGSSRSVSSLVVSSAVGSEGATAVAANLAVVCAQSGYRVVAVDANLRRPGLAELMDLPTAPGLTSVLRGDLPLEEALQRPGSVQALAILASGPPQPEASDLLSSARFVAVLEDLAAQFDLVILDAPEVLCATDAAILGPMASGVVLVTRTGLTRADDLETAVRFLHRVDAHVLGLVVNRSRRGVTRRRSLPRRLTGPAWEDLRPREVTVPRSGDGEV